MNIPIQFHPETTKIIPIQEKKIGFLEKMILNMEGRIFRVPESSSKPLTEFNFAPRS
jgi:hypothetical protein